MEHRHLLPNEIDLLVDGSFSAANAPLRAHLVECDDCRKRVDELRIVSEAVEAVPHFVPKLRFADSVMAGVQVSEPWHLTVSQSAKQLIPTSRPLRLLAGVGASVGAVAISGGAAWLAFRGDRAGWVMDLFVDRGRRGIVNGAREVAAGALGTDAATTLVAGGLPTLAITAAVLATTMILAILAFRRLAATAAAKRS